MAKKTPKKDNQLREAKVVETPEEFDNSFIGDDSMLLPNDGEQMNNDQQEDVEEEIQEDRETFGGNPAIIDAVFEWMDNEIADCDSVEATLAVAKQYEVTKENALVAMDLVRKVFTAKRVSFQNIRDTLESND